MVLRTCLFLTALFTSAATVAGGTVHLESPGPRVSLLELYTSEGCSSCPPADRWMSKLRDDPRLWREVVPVAFHVDYWDYIGWNDRFASPVYSNRQRTYARTRHVSNVYTPGFVLAGKEWRRWFVYPVLDVDDDVDAGKLTLSIDEEQAKMTFVPSIPVGRDLELHVALLGFGLETQVNAGENSGRKLEHDFVVLGYESLPTKRTSDVYSASFPLPDAKVAPPRSAVAAWLSAPGDPRPIQAVGGWLD